MKNTRIDVKMLHSANQKVAENRAIVSVVIEVLLFAARQNIAIRGHDETLQSQNKGNFLELINVISKYHPTLKLHLDKIQNNFNITQKLHTDYKQLFCPIKVKIQFKKF